MPWFERYDDSAPALPAEGALSKVKSIKELDAERSSLPLQDDAPVSVGPVKKLWRELTSTGVRDGDW
jgi:hypothetical protein